MTEISNIYNRLISKDIGKDGTLPQYNCQVQLSETTGRVYQVKFTKKD